MARTLPKHVARRHEHAVLVCGKMLLNYRFDQIAEPVRVDGVEFYGNVTEPACAAVAPFGWPCRQSSIGDLLGRYGDLDVGARSEVVECFLDLFPGVDPGRVEIAKVINLDRVIVAQNVGCLA
jgi:hypothetical protein